MMRKWCKVSMVVWLGVVAALCLAGPLAADGSGATVQSLTIQGPLLVNENSSATYTAIATYSDSSQSTVNPTWRDNLSSAPINTSGVLMAGSVGSNTPVQITATYYQNGIRVTATKNITIVYVPPTGKTLVALGIIGPSSVNAGTTGTYKAKATFSDNPYAATAVSPVWTVTGSAATISNDGVLTALSQLQVSETVTVQASYTYGGVTLMDSMQVTIVVISPPPPVVTLTSLSITGPASVNASATGAYAATAHYSDGSAATVTPVWTVNGTTATITSAGLLTAAAVTSNQSVTVNASYTSGGITQTATLAVSIIASLPPPPPTTTLTGLVVNGPTAMNASLTTSCAATASFSDGTTATVTPVWTVTGTAGTISTAGVLTAAAVTGNVQLTVNASYTTGGVTKTATLPLFVIAPAAANAAYTVFAWNDLGMHCISPRFQYMAILPPANNLMVQVVRRGSEPSLVKSGLNVSYSIPSCTTDVGKTDFYANTLGLFGVTLPQNMGLKGYSLSGSMTFNSDHYEALAIPLVPKTDAGNWNPFQTAMITVKDSTGKTVGTATVTIPVSDELNCGKCHSDNGVATPAIATGTLETNILTAHDQNFGTTLMSNQPVLCSSCHSDNALGTAGVTGVESLSQAMHTKHGSLPTTIQPACYDCHPGANTQCNRSAIPAMGPNGTDPQCTNCHGTLANVGATAAAGRSPWLQEPTCTDCHTSKYATQTGVLYRNSTGMGGVRCAACHNSPHAWWPSLRAEDNIQPISLMGHSGYINQCTVCHTSTPSGTVHGDH